MKIRYLVDENLSARVVATIQRHYPELAVLRVGDAGAPAFGTLDPDLLGWLEINQLQMHHARIAQPSTRCFPSPNARRLPPCLRSRCSSRVR